MSLKYVTNTHLEVSGLGLSECECLVGEILRAIGYPIHILRLVVVPGDSGGLFGRGYMYILLFVIIDVNEVSNENILMM